MWKEYTFCMSTFCFDKPYTTYLKAFMFFKGVYTDDWMVPWVVVRKVFLALLFPNLIVSLVTAANEIINQQHAATNCNRQIFLPCTI